MLRGESLRRIAADGDVSPETLARLFRDYVGITSEELVVFVHDAGQQGDRLAPSRVLALAVPYLPPFDFTSLLALLRARIAPGVERVTDAAYQRTFVQGRTAGILEVRSAPGQCLNVRIQADRWTDLVHVVERTRHLFNLDVNAQEARMWLHNDPIVGHLVQERPGVRPPGSWSPFEAAVKAVLGCGWDVRGQDWLEQVVRCAGEAMHAATPARVDRLFPLPEQVASRPPDRLGLPFVKARSIHQLARAAVAGAAVATESVSMQRRLAAFVGIDGVGPVTGARFAWLLGEPDAYPEKVGAPMPGTTATRNRKRARELADRWRPFRSFAYAQLALSDASSDAGVDGWADPGPEHGLSA